MRACQMGCQVRRAALKGDLVGSINPLKIVSLSWQLPENEFMAQLIDLLAVVIIGHSLFLLDHCLHSCSRRACDLANGLRADAGISREPLVTWLCLAIP